MVAELAERGLPVITQYELFWMVHKAYEFSSQKKLYLRSERPSREDFIRLRKNLTSSGALQRDKNYGDRVYYITFLPDLPAEDIICLVDRYCYVAYLSAMQRWGLTNRFSNDVQLVRPNRDGVKRLLSDQIQKDAQEFGYEKLPIELKNIRHPGRVRQRTISVNEVTQVGAYVKVRGTQTRVSTIEQTFLDTLVRPDLCGGMTHVMDVWGEHAGVHLKGIISHLDASARGLVLSRAGYIIEHYFDVSDPRLDKWAERAVRGGTRLLDPAKPYADKYSERWCISLNA